MISFFLSEMCITAVNPSRNTTCQYYSTKPKQMCEISLNGIIDENPHLINSLDRTSHHPFIRKYSHIPFSSL